MPKLLKLDGKRFGKLTVVCKVGVSKQTLWKCMCDCGKEIVLETGKLTSNHTKSCGCYRSERIAKHNTIHNGSYSKLYGVYRSMVNRCNSKTNQAFMNYGGRGISVCDDWIGKNGFVNFRNWSIENGYSERLTIDRIDVNGNYEPTNCRFVTMKVQQNNKRNNNKLELYGEIKSFQEWCDYFGVNRCTAKSRIDRGWSIEDAFKRPIVKGVQNA